MVNVLHALHAPTCELFPQHILPSLLMIDQESPLVYLMISVAVASFAKTICDVIKEGLRHLRVSDVVDLEANAVEVDSNDLWRIREVDDDDVREASDEKKYLEPMSDCKETDSGNSWQTDSKDPVSKVAVEGAVAPDPQATDRIVAMQTRNRETAARRASGARSLSLLGKLYVPRQEPTVTLPVIPEHDPIGMKKVAD